MAKVRALRGKSLPELVEGIARELHELMGAPAAVVRPVRHGEGYSLDFASARGLAPAAFAEFAALLRTTPSGVLLFDPARPARSQRNTVHETAIDQPHAAQGAMHVVRAMGLGGSTQLRFLLCDGPMLIAWLGAFFPRERRVTNRDRTRLRRFAMGVKPLLRLAARVGASIAADALDAMMAAYPGEAYLVHADGRIECANERGARVIEERGAAVQLELLRAVSGAEGGPFAVHPVGRGDRKPLSVLTRSAHDDTSLEGRLSLAARTWSLSAKQVEVLRGLANGKANKDIVSGSGMSLRTVEVHVTALLRKARADSRLALVALLWRGH